MNKITQEQALQILINAVQLANTKGAFQLAESKTIAEAVEMFTKPVAVGEAEKPTEQVEKGETKAVK